METLEFASCDNCLSPLDPKECVADEHTLTCTLRRHRIEKLPMPVATASAGDPAVLCAACLGADSCWKWVSWRIGVLTPPSVRGYEAGIRRSPGGRAAASRNVLRFRPCSWPKCMASRFTFQKRSLCGRARFMLAGIVERSS